MYDYAERTLNDGYATSAISAVGGDPKYFLVLALGAGGRTASHGSVIFEGSLVQMAEQFPDLAREAGSLVPGEAVTIECENVIVRLRMAGEK